MRGSCLSSQLGFLAIARASSPYVTSGNENVKMEVYTFLFHSFLAESPLLMSASPGGAGSGQVRPAEEDRLLDLSTPQGSM